MATLNPKDIMKSLQQGVTTEIANHFPFDSPRHRLDVSRVYTGDVDVAIDAVEDQKSAKLRGRTWAVPIYGDLKLISRKTGKVVDQAKRVKLANLPVITRRFSYIVDGTEYQADNQWRLKSGVYTRVKENGELETVFNLVKGRGFKMMFDPKTMRYSVRYGDSVIPAMSVMRGLGISEDLMRTVWGDKIYAANKHWSKYDRDMRKFHKAASGRITDSTAEGELNLRETMDETQVLPETTRITLGKDYEKVTGDMLLRASAKILGVSRGTVEPDRRDSLQYKHLLTIDDLMTERIKNSGKRIRERIANNLNRKTKIRDIISSDIFNLPIRTLFSKTSIANTTEMTNPIRMASAQLRTTPMGPGGISTEHRVTRDAKLMDPSQIGYIDPLHTPEGPKTGVSLQLALGIRKKGRVPMVEMYNVKTGKKDLVSPSELVDKVVALPDQYRWKKGRPTPIAPRIKAVGEGNQFGEIKHSEVDYILPSSRRLFSLTANFVPFLQNSHGQRVNMAVRHLEQSISLKNRETPLVQVALTPDGQKTFEGEFGVLSSHLSPVNGRVTSVAKNHVRIRDDKGKIHKVQLYDHYPLNDGQSFIHAEPKVKAGDQVKQKQLLADTNFTRDGQLALGTNLRMAYVDYKGYTYEDGFTISESAAEKLTSEHLRQKSITVGKEVVLGRDKYRAYYPDRLTENQAKTLDDDGIIKPGTEVEEGSPLVVALRKSDPTKEALLMKGLHRSLVRPYTDKSLTWTGGRGVVQNVIKQGKKVLVLVKTEEPAQIGDKVSGRYGNKGVITRIVPDAEMPHDKDGNPIDIMMSPVSVAGRMNLGQVYETALAKVAKKEGQPIAVSNFESRPGMKIVRVKGHYRRVKTKEGPKRIFIQPYEYEKSYLEAVEDKLQEAGMSDRETLYDPVTGHPLRDDQGRDPLVGYQYILKLEHQSAKKMSARAQGYGYDYDINLVPKGGGPHGAQSIGELGLYAMLAHGALSNIREMYTIKSDRAQDEAWSALQAGESLPPPKPTFAFNKFVSYLNALGLNVDKQGNSLTLVPFTDDQILELSNGEIRKPGLTLRSKDLKEEKGGLFDEEVTGGVGGSKWAHIKLAEPIPNPLFEKAIQSLLGIKRKEYIDILAGRKGFDSQGNLVDTEDAVLNGGPGIKAMLSKIDRDKELSEAEAAIKSARKSKLNALNKKIKYLRALKKNDLDPTVYMLNHVPVLPPQFRPVSVLESGDLNEDDLTGLYKDVGLLNQQLREFDPGLPDEERNPLRAELYDGLRALYGLGASPRKSAHKGVLEILTPTKTGYFHSKILSRKQDITGRGIIVPEEDLSLDEVGLPRDMAREMFRPFVARELVKSGYTPLQALEAIDGRREVAENALDVVVQNRPVLLKRDPVLHKFGIMAFKPKLVSGKVIQIHPLVTGGFNADFDGDSMSVYVPVTQEAVEEAYKMFPSRNLFNPATGEVMYLPSKSNLVGLYRLSEWGKSTRKSFKTPRQAQTAARDGKIGFTDVITVGGRRTTAGRLLIDSKLPKAMQGGRLLDNPKYVLDKTSVAGILTHVANNHKSDFGKVADSLKDMGFFYNYRSGMSFGLEDLKPFRKIRDTALRKARAKIEIARAKYKGKDLNDRIVKAYQQASKEMETKAKAAMEKMNSRLNAIGKSGQKPGWTQIKQMILAPMLLQDMDGNIIPVPVTRSYAEGLDASDFLISGAAARQTIMEKVQEVREPGYLTKQIMNTANRLVVSEDNCGTKQGVALSSDSRDVLDRYLAAPIKVKGKILPTGTMVTPSIQSDIRKAKVDKILVRSPLKCQSHIGVCQHCYGLDEYGKNPDVGRNVGVLATQAFGERGVQLTMRTFHTGGVAGSKGLVGMLDRVNQILQMPEILPGSATLSRVKGKVESVAKSPAGGWDVTVGGEQHYVPQDRGLKVKAGTAVKKGQPLSGGPINPRELLPLTGLADVQNMMSSELHNIYSSEGVRRKHAEVVVKALTNLAQVNDPGGNQDLLRGDLVPINRIQAWNRQNPEKPIRHTPVLKGILTAPLGLQEDWLARLQFQRLGDTLVEAAQKGWPTNIHGEHPMPALAYAAEFGKPPEDKPWAY